MKELFEVLKKNNLTLGSVESLTGGLFASTVTSFSGASAVYKGSLITYSPLVKESVCDVDKSIIEKYGVVSHECAYAMAKNGAQILDTDVCVSFTGNAGPTALDGLPVGRIYVGVSYKNEVSTYEFNILNKDRNEVRSCIVEEAIKLLLKIIKE